MLGGRSPLSQMGKLRLGEGVWRSCQQWRLPLASVTTGGGARPPGIPDGAPAPPACHSRPALARRSPAAASQESHARRPWDRREPLLTLRRRDGCAPEKICDFRSQKGEDRCVFTLRLCSAADPLQTLGKSSTSLCFGFVVFKVDGACVLD